MNNSIPERARWSAYFALDALRGGIVGKRVRSNQYAFRHGSSLEETEKKIRDLIEHACQTTAYYRHYDKGVSLEDLPVVDKNLFRQRYDEFISDPYRNRKDNRIMSTSGSTGTPLQMIQDRKKALCNTADSIFLESLAGYHIGEKMAFLRVWVNNVRKSKLQLLAENSIMMDSSSLSDESIEDMLKVLKDRKVKMITGYASALTEVSNYIQRNQIDTSGFSLHSIIPISETLASPVRKQLMDQFHCPVRQTYSNEENGIMGIQYGDSEAYYINTESYYYEILKMDSDEPCEEGELGRIVITDLTNYAFPILRYDNGDTAIAKKTVHNGRYRMKLTELYGRRSDILYDTKGKAVTPYVITNNLWDAKGVLQYRFLQTGQKEYELQLCGNEQEMDVPDILSRIQPAFGEDAKIRVQFVNEVPVLASGKRKYIENLYEANS